MTPRNPTDGNGQPATQRPSGDSPERDGDAPWVDIEHAPPRLSQTVAAGGAVVGVGLSAPFATLAVPFGLAGLFVFGVALAVTYSVQWLTAGVGLIAAGALVSGSYGAVPPELLLLAVGATVVAWDAGQHGIVVGEQLGRDARSRRLQLVHTAATTLVVGLACSFVYLVYLLGSDGRPEPAVAAAVLGAVLSAWLLRR